MFILRKSELARSQWPFEPWPARRWNALVGWGDATPGLRQASTPFTLWKVSLVVLGMLSVIMSSAVVIAQIAYRRCQKRP